MKKGATTIPLVVVIGTIFTWCAALSIGMFNDHASIAGQTASIEDIKTNVQEIKATVHDIDNRASLTSYYRLSTSTIYQ